MSLNGWRKGETRVVHATLGAGLYMGIVDGLPVVEFDRKEVSKSAVLWHDLRKEKSDDSDEVLLRGKCDTANQGG